MRISSCNKWVGKPETMAIWHDITINWGLNINTDTRGKHGFMVHFFCKVVARYSPVFGGEGSYTTDCLTMFSTGERVEFYPTGYWAASHFRIYSAIGREVHQININGTLWHPIRHPWKPISSHFDSIIFHPPCHVYSLRWLSLLSLASCWRHCRSGDGIVSAVGSPQNPRSRGCRSDQAVLFWKYSRNQLNFQVSMMVHVQIFRDTSWTNWTNLQSSSQDVSLKMVGKPPKLSFDWGEWLASGSRDTLLDQSIEAKCVELQSPAPDLCVCKKCWRIQD